jgi:hypothetical protein
MTPPTYLGVDDLVPDLREEEAGLLHHLGPDGVLHFVVVVSALLNTLQQATLH